MGTFNDRATTVADHLVDLGLGRIEPPVADELAKADAKVDEHVERVRAGLATDIDLDELAGDLVSGKIKPETAAKRLNAPAGARVSNLVEKVRQHAVAAEDSPDYSPAALRRSCVDEVRARIQRTADDMLSSIAGLPGVARDHLTQVVDGQYGRLYGPAPADQLTDLLDVVAPNGDLASVRPDDLQAVQRARSAWQWWNEAAGQCFDPLWWLGTGTASSTTYAGDRVGAGAAEAEQFDPALLLVAGADVDYIASGLKLPYLVADGLVTELKPLGDPYGDDADAYAARVDRARQFVEWRDEARDTAVAGAGHLMPREQFRGLQRRAELNKLDAVAAFREHAGAAS